MVLIMPWPMVLQLKISKRQKWLAIGIFMLGASSYVEPIFDGAILLVAIVLAKLSARRLSGS